VYKRKEYNPSARRISHSSPENPEDLCWQNEIGYMIYTLFEGRSGNHLPGDVCHNLEILLARGQSEEEKQEAVYFV
jgi:hypothetical protein